MTEDIRQKEDLNHKDIITLNFISDDTPYFFRKHFREGLRSRLMQVLNPVDVQKEIKGVLHEGVRSFPTARPLKILRIFNKRFQAYQDIRKEIDNYQKIRRYLPGYHYAASQEFIVDYIRSGTRHPLLCGLQEFVEGESVDPWHPDIHARLSSILSDAEAIANLEKLKIRVASFVDGIKQMIQEAGCVPDLAGIGNILITPSAGVKLVDINNISRLAFDHQIHLDDRGYPVCDKSIDALSQLEANILGRHCHTGDPVYTFYLDPKRMKTVREFEKIFHESTSAGSHYPPPVG